MMLAGVLALASTVAVAEPAVDMDSVVTTWPVAVASTPEALGVSADRQEVNGRLWVSRPVIGGVEIAGRAGHPSERYGAADARGALAVVMVEGLFPFQRGIVAAIDPWRAANDRSDRRNPYGNPYQDAHDRLADRLEEARQQWLKDNNFVGGVRTFVNDAATWKPAPAVQSDAGGAPGEIQPRATIQVSPEVPRRARPFRVDATPAGETPAMRVSMPVRAATPGLIVRAADVQCGDAAAVAQTADSRR